MLVRYAVKGNFQSTDLQTWPPGVWPLPGGGLGCVVDRAAEDAGLGTCDEGEASGIGLSPELGDMLLDFRWMARASGRRDDSLGCWFNGEAPSRGLDDVGLEGRAVRIVEESRGCPAGPSCGASSSIAMQRLRRSAGPLTRSGVRSEGTTRYLDHESAALGTGSGSVGSVDLSLWLIKG